MYLIVYIFHRNKWIFGAFLCNMAMPTFGVPIFSSSLAIMMIAVDRYMLIVFPFKKRMSPRQAILTVVAIVLFTVLLTTPLFVHVEFKSLGLDSVNLGVTNFTMSAEDHELVSDVISGWISNLRNLSGILKR